MLSHLKRLFITYVTLNISQSYMTSSPTAALYCEVSWLEQLLCHQISLLRTTGHSPRLKTLKLLNVFSSIFFRGLFNLSKTLKLMCALVTPSPSSLVAIHCIQAQARFYPKVSPEVKQQQLEGATSLNSRKPTKTATSNQSFRIIDET